MVVFMKKLRRVVIYILNFNNEFRRWFQRSVSVSVYRLCRESVLSSFFPVQCLCCMDVPWFVINNKNDSCSFTWENVFNVSISRINIWMKLQNQKQTYLNKKGIHFIYVFMKFKSSQNHYHFSYLVLHQAIIGSRAHAVNTAALHSGQLPAQTCVPVQPGRYWDPGSKI